MRPVLTALLALALAAPSFPQVVILGSDKEEDRANRVSVLVVGDGWKDVRAFQAAAKHLVQGVFAVDPLKDLKELFVVTAVDPDPPPGAGDDDEDAAAEPPTSPAEPPRPYYQSRFQSTHDEAEANVFVQQGGRAWFGDDFPLAGQHLADTHPEIARHAVIVLLNNDGDAGGARFGDGGAPGILVVTSGASADLAAHMLGHALFGLADEYTNRGDGPALTAPDAEPAEPNVTLVGDAERVKWKALVDPKYAKPAEGARWCPRGVYRSGQGCVMNHDHTHFCAVCKARILERIREVASVIDRVEPKDLALTLTAGAGLTARVEPAAAAHAPLEGEWFLDGQLQAAPAPKAGGAWELALAKLPPGHHLLRFLAADATVYAGPKPERPRRPLFQRDWLLDVRGTALPVPTPRSSP